MLCWDGQLVSSCEGDASKPGIQTPSQTDKHTPGKMVHMEAEEMGLKGTPLPFSSTWTTQSLLGSMWVPSRTDTPISPSPCAAPKHRYSADIPTAPAPRRYTRYNAISPCPAPHRYTDTHIYHQPPPPHRHTDTPTAPSTAPIRRYLASPCAAPIHRYTDIPQPLRRTDTPIHRYPPSPGYRRIGAASISPQPRISAYRRRTDIPRAPISPEPRISAYRRRTDIPPAPDIVGEDVSCTYTRMDGRATSMRNRSMPLQAIGHERARLPQGLGSCLWLVARRTSQSSSGSSLASFSMPHASSRPCCVGVGRTAAERRGLDARTRLFHV